MLPFRGFLNMGCLLLLGPQPKGVGDLMLYMVLGFMGSGFW